MFDSSRGHHEKYQTFVWYFLWSTKSKTLKFLSNDEKIIPNLNVNPKRVHFCTLFRKIKIFYLFLISLKTLNKTGKTDIKIIIPAIGKIYLSGFGIILPKKYPPKIIPEAHTRPPKTL